MSQNEELLPVPESPLRAFLRGFRYPARGWAFIRRHKLWGACVWPMAVSILLLVTMVAVTAFYLGDLRDSIWSKPEGEGFWATVKMALWWAMSSAFAIVAILAEVLLFVVLSTVIAGPFLDHLVERSEEILWGQPGGRFRIRTLVRVIAFTIRDMLSLLLAYALVAVVLFLVNLVPVAGTIVYAALSWVAAVLFLALEFLSFTLNRRLVSFRVKWRIVRSNVWASLGFGTAAFLAVFVPVLNVVLLPFAVVGGTLFFGELRLSNKLPPEALRQPV